MAHQCRCHLHFQRLLFTLIIALWCRVTISRSNCSDIAGHRGEFVMRQHQLRGTFTLLKNCSFRVSEFDMLQGSDVRWWGATGDSFHDLINGFVISNDKLNRTYKNETLVVDLMSDLTWDKIRVVSVWDLSMASDFGHVFVSHSTHNYGKSSGYRRHSQPTMFDNCRVLSPVYRVRWSLREEDNVIDVGLEANTELQNYMAFGWANTNSTHGYMLYSDVTVAGLSEELSPFAQDYYITDYKECTVDQSGAVYGVCPDSPRFNASSTENTKVVYGHRKDGVSFVRFEKLLAAIDMNYDHPVNRTGNATIIWALGKLKPPDSIWPYYLPEYHGELRKVDYGYLKLNISGHINNCLGPMEGHDKQDQDLVIADAKAVLEVTCGPALHYPNPPNPSTVLYINKKEAPLLRVERGLTVRFALQAGEDVGFYITSDPLGGNSTRRNESEIIYAGGSEFKGVPDRPKELTWEIDRNTPDEVFYQSLSQQKMGWKVEVVDGGLSDTYNNTVILDDEQVSFFWTLSNDSISIAARGEEKSGYLAIGFGNGMVNSFAYVGWVDEEGKGRLNTYYIDGREPSSNLHPTRENLTYAKVKSENEIITLEFARALSPSCQLGERPECSNIIEPTIPLKVIWAMGAKWSLDTLSEENMHFAMSSKPVRILLLSGTEEAEQDVTPVLGVHGFMMFLAWGILLPCGVLAARYLKQVRGDGWYRTHVYLQYSGLCIVLLGFLFAIAELGGFFTHSLHVKIGMTAIILACAQPINVWWKPNKNPVSKTRLIWEYFHANMGRSVVIMGYVALYTGLKHLGYKYGVDVEGIRQLLLFWFLTCGVMTLFLELGHRRKMKNVGSGVSAGDWVLGNIDEVDDSTDLLSGDSEVDREKDSIVSETMEIQLEPLNR